MGKVVVMPKLGLTMTEGTVDEWKKNEGESASGWEVTDRLNREGYNSSTCSPYT